MKPITDLQQLASDEELKEDENFHFREFLAKHDDEIIDAKVFKLNEIIAPQINCTECGNCCKTLMVNITENESVDLAVFLKIQIQDLKEKYIETSLQGNMILNKIPCHFLSGTVCSIYENRFTECKEFPRLHLPKFRSRLFATFMHYGRCPIIYNVIEELKKQTGFIEMS